MSDFLLLPTAVQKAALLVYTSLQHCRRHIIILPLFAVPCYSLLLRFFPIRIHRVFLCIVPAYLFPENQTYFRKEILPTAIAWTRSRSASIKRSLQNAEIDYYNILCCGGTSSCCGLVSVWIYKIQRYFFTENDG